MLHKKTLYLENQFKSIDTYHNTELKAEVWKKLKSYKHSRSLKTARSKYYSQIYIYKLGKSIFKQLTLNR